MSKNDMRYVDARLAMLRQMIEDRDIQVATAMAAAERAVGKANEANERRLNLLNEFRAQAADESAHYARREVVDEVVARLNERIEENAKMISLLQGRALAFAGGGAAVGAMSASAITTLLT